MKPCIFGCRSTSLSKEEGRFFNNADPFGFILFARNCVNPKQVSNLVEELRNSVGRMAPVLIDQEGGRVQRMSSPVWRQWPPPSFFGSLYSTDSQKALKLANLTGRLIAEDLYEVGIDVNCAPVLDLKEIGGHGVIGNRAFGSDPEVVTTLARSWMNGLLEGGVLPIIKHLPGHGRATVDSHYKVPEINISIEVLEGRDFRPFINFNQKPIGMTGHLLFSTIDAEHPATLSKKIINRIIREKIGFNGLLVTDDLSMLALKGSLSTRTKGALVAGCDIALHCNGNLTEMALVADSVSGFSELGLKRVESMYDVRQAVQAKRDCIDRRSLLEQFKISMASLGET